MEKKNNNNKALFIVIGILGGLVLLLLLLVIVLLLFSGIGRQMQNKDDPPGPRITKDENTTEDDILGDEVIRGDNGMSNSITMIIDGFKFTVPGEYDCFFSYEIGPVVYLDDVFQMKTAVREGTYEEMMQDPDSITTKTVEAGGSILQEVRETEYEGKKYAYFRMQLMDDICFVIYTQAADTDSRVAGQIVVENSELTDEDLIHVFASIAGTAQVTDEADSDYDDIVDQMAVRTFAVGERKEESSLSLDGVTVTFCVPEGFYSQGIYETDFYSAENFQTQDYAIGVDCYLQADEMFANAEEYLENELEGSFNDTSGIRIQKTEIDGKTCYYYEEVLAYDDSEFQRISAVCDIDGNGTLYYVRASAIDEDTGVSIDTIRDFFVFR